MGLSWRGDPAGRHGRYGGLLVLLTQASRAGAPGADAAGSDPQPVLVCRNFKGFPDEV